MGWGFGGLGLFLGLGICRGWSGFGGEIRDKGERESWIEEGDEDWHGVGEDAEKTRVLWVCGWSRKENKTDAKGRG